MKKIISTLLIALMLISSLLALASCSSVVGIDGLDGKDGINGADGIDGKDGLNGKDGKNGADGIDGEDGKNGEDGEDGRNGKNGVNGDVPMIGANGNWWIGATDTGIKAQGEKGDKGDAGKDGSDAKDGADGKDAFADPKFRLNAITGNFEISYDNGESWTAIGAASNDFDPNADFSFPIDLLTLLDGVIDSESKKYTISANSRGAIIDLSNLDFDYVKLVKNESGKPIFYAFLKSAPASGSTSDFATGYTAVITELSGSKTVKIPDDAKYLYVRYSDKEAGDGSITYCVPDSITFTNNK